MALLSTNHESYLETRLEELERRNQLLEAENERRPGGTFDRRPASADAFIQLRACPIQTGVSSGRFDRRGGSLALFGKGTWPQSCCCGGDQRSRDGQPRRSLEGQNAG